jgi:predicted permease
MINVILNALLPVVVTLGLGMLAGWHRDHDVRSAKSLNRMVLVYALPLALFAGTVTIPRPELLGDWPLLAVMVAGTVLPFTTALLIGLYLVHRPLKAAALQAMVFGMPAIAFTGLAILTPLIGKAATVVVDFAGLTANILILPATLVLLAFAQAGGDEGHQEDQHAHGRPDHEGETKERSKARSTWSTVARALRESLVQPVVLAPVVAIAAVLANIHLPDVVSSSLKLLGSTVGGISLFASGIILQSQPLTFSVPAAISAACRLLLIPGLAYAAFSLLGSSGDLRKFSVLGLSLAAAPMQVILSTRYQTAERENASALLYTNVLCIPTLALFIWLTQ